MYVRCKVRAFTLIVLVVVTTFEKMGSVHIGHASSLVHAYKCTCIMLLYRCTLVFPSGTELFPVTVDLTMIS